ncbi:lactonase family protein [Natrialba asiatica]|uniref:6-phosphogluconolactonase n=1 Tax=Natrialba asiatica (strain ATCC 700177 / DSM 12278 / JCM 9576 / FERM P-10747 / NBRC 102637 / 172P1) TaxID=29540 RepID=M0B3F6_NATA1|nr:lactonase family protein [Natrialba asiatica]ELZ05436.1 6-phosphogluconolactonase [Natrialba asiatica DSM 12278]
MSVRTRETIRVLVCSAGSNGDGIVDIELAADGTVTERTRVPAANPAFLSVHPDGKSLYTVERAAGGRLVAYRLNDGCGDLSRLNERSSEGAAPCYVSVDATGRYAFVANYRGGTVAAFPIESDGRVGEASDVVRHEGTGPDQDRQSAPHPHAIEPGPRNRFCYAPDLGTDRIAIYRPDADAGELKAAETEPATARAGAGPRQIAFHPTASVCYVVGELESTVSEFSRDRESGALTAVGRTSTLPSEFGGDNAPAAVGVHPSGRWVYVSNRGHDSIAVFAVDRASGSLERIGHQSTRGETPRDIALSPGGEFLLAANQHGDSLVAFAIDGDGRLDARAELAVPKPVCVTVLDPR